MKQQPIISRGESMRILANDLRKAALEKQATDLSKASAEERQAMIRQIEQDIQNELRRRTLRCEPGNLLH